MNNRFLENLITQNTNIRIRPPPPQISDLPTPLIQKLTSFIHANIQALIEDKLVGNEKTEMFDWFVSLMTRILKMMPCKKQRAVLVSSLFDVWEETILGLHEDVHALSSKSLQHKLN